MKTEKIGSHVLKIYDSVDSLPIDRFFKFNLNLLIDSGIGGDLESIDSHLSVLAKFISEGEKEKAGVKLENLRTAFSFVLQNINPKSRAFICLIKEIDGEPFNDLTDQGIEKMILRLGKAGATKGFIYSLVEALKKKFNEELKIFFPNEFGMDGRTKEFFGDVLARTKSLLKFIITKNEQFLEQIETIDKTLFQMIKPQSYSGAKGVEAVFIRQYEEMNIILAENFHIQPKNYTVLEYYTAGKLLKQKIEAQRPKGGRNKAFVG